MYCDYFGFNREPFSISPDPDFLYPSAQHRQALAHLKYGLGREGGFLLLTGEVGTGKTTICRLLIEQVPATTRIAYLLNTQYDSADLLASICKELHIELPSEPLKVKNYIDLLYQDLLASHSRGNKTLVIVEEAQNLSPDVLEMLRLLTNLETNTSKLLHILLVGQPELLGVIAQPGLRQLNQRVISRFHLEALNLSECGNYLDYRIRKAGGRRQLFTRGAVKALHRQSGGIPRMLNLLAERSLLGIYGAGKSEVSAAVVNKAASEVKGVSLPKKIPESNQGNSRLGWVAIGLAAVAAWLLILVLASPSEVQEIPVTAEVSTDQLEDISPGRTASQLLLELWKVPYEDIGTEFCEQAGRSDLRCETLASQSLAEIVELNRPALITLRESVDRQSTYLIASLEDGIVSLKNAQGSENWTLDEFEKAWVGDYQFLWQPPRGYLQDLSPGDINWAITSWLEDKLVLTGISDERVVSAGVYSQPLVDRVIEFQSRHGLDVDGILGMRTIMKMNEIDQSVPMLSRSQRVQAD